MESLMDSAKTERLIKIIGFRTLELEAQVLALRGLLETMNPPLPKALFQIAIESARVQVRKQYALPEHPQELFDIALEDVLRAFEGPVQ
jgi:hypothetical protein